MLRCPVFTNPTSAVMRNACSRVVTSNTNLILRRSSVALNTFSALGFSSSTCSVSHQCNSIRFSASSSNSVGTFAPATIHQSASSKEKHADDLAKLSDLKEVSEEDKELLRQAFFEPDKVPKFEKQPMGDGGGAGNKHGDMAAVFTCNVCKHRSVKRFSRHSYTKGVVMVQCSGCGNKHLLADHLGWFEDGHKTIEDILREKGEEVKRLSVAVHIDSPEEVALDAAEAALAAFENNAKS